MIEVSFRYMERRAMKDLASAGVQSARRASAESMAKVNRARDFIEKHRN